MHLTHRQVTDTGFDREMGANHGGDGAAVFRATNEDEMGQLQPCRRKYQAKHRSGEEAAGVPGIHRRA